MPPITRFEEIESWQMARELTKTVYGLTRQHGFAKDWGLKDQIQRAAGSAMHNIAEEFDAGSHVEFARFLRYAERSCTEVQSELYVALDQKYIDQRAIRRLLRASGKNTFQNRRLHPLPNHEKKKIVLS